MQTKPVEVRVKPLPQEPEDSSVRSSNLVGDFKWEATLSQEKAKIGDSVTLTVSVEGRGNLWDLRLPKMVFDNFKVYADKPVMEKLLYRNRILGGKKTFKFALIPRATGRQTLKFPKIRFFSPSDENYRVLVHADLKIDIDAADTPSVVTHVSSRGVGKKQKVVQQLGSDLVG